MSKNLGNSDFDYILMNGQKRRRCTRVNVIQLVIFVLAFVTVFYFGRYSNNDCDFNAGVYRQRLDFFENDTISEEDLSMNVSTTTPSLDPYLETLSRKIKCFDKGTDFRIERRGPFWVLKNYIPAAIRPKCYETITYTTHGDYSFLDNLIPLLQRWLAPISIAIYCPGTDYDTALDSVMYLRNCATEHQLIRDYVTFHFYFDRIHTPKNIVKNITFHESKYKCQVMAPFMDVSQTSMYKSKQNLTYPVNVGRNVAREASVTHFLLPSDIELFPNPGLVTQFLRMYSKMKDDAMKEVFVLPIFEVKANETVPIEKSTLQKMLKTGAAIPFHFKICATCHSVPGQKEWISAKSKPNEMVIHATSKRVGKFVHWEPIFISTHSEPLYEEMLSWEGKSDKMTQGYVLCVLDYNFNVLSEGFLVHRPGIKTISEAHRPEMERKALKLIRSEIVPQVEALYGTRSGCKP